MPRTIILQGIVSFIIFAIIPCLSYASYDGALSLSEAERLAISNAPELKQYQANAQALRAQAIADAQWADPQLIVGAANVPTNSFSFNQDDMTMMQFGLQQTFAPGHSLAMKSKKTKALARAQQEKVQEQAAMLLRNVREAWLDLYYWQQAGKIVRENRSLYRNLLKASESQYSSGKGTQSDVLQIQVEASRLNDQLAQVEQRLDIARAQLGRWIGADAASRSVGKTLPRWAKPVSAQALQARLMEHPLLKVDTANIDAARDEVAYAKEQYKPGWTLDVGYAVRHGRLEDGQPRSNFVGAQVTIDLPLFTGSRQDQRMNASASQLTSVQLERDVHYKDLLKELNVQYAVWKSYSKRAALYQHQLAPEAAQNSKAALLAYQNASADLTTVLRAYSNQLSIRLERIQIQVERAKARAAILYLEGVTS